MLNRNININLLFIRKVYQKVHKIELVEIDNKLTYILNYTPLVVAILLLIFIFDPLTI